MTGSRNLAKTCHPPQLQKFLLPQQSPYSTSVLPLALATRTPDMSQMLSNNVSPSKVDKDSKLASRLDQLMTSITLSATSHK